MAKTLKVLTALLALCGVVTATAFAAKAHLELSRSKGKVGSSVTATATGLKSGRYIMSVQGTSSPGGSCYEEFGPVKMADKGRVKLTAKIPKRIHCHGAESTTSYKLTPGKYRLQVSAPVSASRARSTVSSPFRVVK